jgi:hypothetical protein
MALFFECMPQCAQKLLDTADIVRDAIFRQPRVPEPFGYNAVRTLRTRLSVCFAFGTRSWVSAATQEPEWLNPKGLLNSFRFSEQASRLP